MTSAPPVTRASGLVPALRLLAEIGAVRCSSLSRREPNELHSQTISGLMRREWVQRINLTPSSRALYVLTQAGADAAALVLAAEAVAS